MQRTMLPALRRGLELAAAAALANQLAARVVARMGARPVVPIPGELTTGA